MNTYYIEPHEFRDVKRYELLGRIEQGWTVRLKGSEYELNKASCSDTCTVRLMDLVKGQWEGRPPVPDLVKHVDKYFLNEAITAAKCTPNSYIREKTWPEGKFIKWDSDEQRFFHVFEYPKVNKDNAVSFSGSNFNSASYELWLEK